MNAVAKNDAAAFKAAYRQLAPNIMQSLPSHIPAERFERAAMVAVQRNADLLTKADRRSLFLALQRAAQDGLLPDGREGAIVLFGNQAQWMPMVAGLMKLARNSGEIASISAHVAYRGEKFTVVLGDEEHIVHERNLELADNAEVIAVYAVATLKNGEKVREVMTRAQVEKVRNVSRAKNNGPWVAWFEEMCRKTCIRRLSKRLPLSTDRDGDARLERAVEHVDDAVTIDGRAEPEYPGTNTGDDSSRLDVLESMVPDEPAPVNEPPDVDTQMALVWAAELAGYASEEAIVAFSNRADVAKVIKGWRKDRPELVRMVKSAGETRIKELAGDAPPSLEDDGILPSGFGDADNA